MPRCKIGDIAIILHNSWLEHENPGSIGVIVNILARSDHPNSVRFPPGTIFWEVKTAHPVLRTYRRGYQKHVIGVPDNWLQPIRPSEKAIDSYMLNALDHALSDMLNKR